MLARHLIRACQDMEMGDTVTLMVVALIQDIKVGKSQKLNKMMEMSPVV